MHRKIGDKQTRRDYRRENEIIIRDLHCDFGSFYFVVASLARTRTQSARLIRARILLHWPVGAHTRETECQQCIPASVEHITKKK